MSHISKVFLTKKILNSRPDLQKHMTTSRHRWGHQHISSNDTMALEELCEALDHDTAPWPTAPWQVLSISQMLFGKIVFCSFLLFLHRGLFWTVSIFHTSVSASWNRRNHSWGWVGDVARAACCTVLAVVFRGRCCPKPIGQKPLSPHQFTEKLPFNLLTFWNWWPKD